MRRKEAITHHKLDKTDFAPQVAPPEIGIAAKKEKTKPAKSAERSKSKQKAKSDKARPKDG